jgi:hypothetical protein
VGYLLDRTAAIFPGWAGLARWPWGNPTRGIVAHRRFPDGPLVVSFAEKPRRDEPEKRVIVEKDANDLQELLISPLAPHRKGRRHSEQFAPSVAPSTVYSTPMASSILARQAASS